MTRTVVLINGEKQTGKTTLANQVMDLCQTIGNSAAPYSLVTPVYPAALAFCGIKPEEIDYETFKRTPVLPGLDIEGRDVMIALGNAARGLSPYFLNTVFMTYAMQHPEIDTWIIENWGFEIEYQFFLEAEPASLFNNIVLIHLDTRATRRYEHGEQFDGDNRFCCRDLAHLVNPQPGEVLMRITGEYKNHFYFTPEEALTHFDSEDDSMWEDDGRPSFAKLREITRRPDLSDEDIQGIIEKYGFPNREQLRKWSILGNETSVQPEPAEEKQGHWLDDTTHGFKHN